MLYRSMIGCYFTKMKIHDENKELKQKGEQIQLEEFNITYVYREGLNKLF